MLREDSYESEVASGQINPNPRDNITWDLAWDKRRKDHLAPLGAKLTGCRLFNTSVILGFGIAKAAFSYRGQAVTSATLDWIVGSGLALILYWLSVFETSRPETYPRFFQVDYAPPILRFMRRSKGGHRSVVSVVEDESKDERMMGSKKETNEEKMMRLLRESDFL